MCITRQNSSVMRVLNVSKMSKLKKSSKNNGFLSFAPPPSQFSNQFCDEWRAYNRLNYLLNKILGGFLLATTSVWSMLKHKINL
jgi:hypothetical protein